MKYSTSEFKKYLSGMDIIGEIAIIKIKPDFLSKKTEIGNVILSNISNLKSVFLQETGVEGEFRVKKIKFLSGIDDSITIYKESGCRFLIDVSKVYFSPRLSNERLRIAQLVKSNERILNMFAGVGPFSIIISKVQPNCQIIDIEINPIAHEYAKENYSLNKITNISSICGNSHQIIKNQFPDNFNRVIMPLPEKSVEFIDDAIYSLKKQGWIHLYVHLNCPDNNVLSYANEFIAKKLNNSSEIRFSRIVKNIGPGWYQIGFDIKINK